MTTAATARRARSSRSLKCPHSAEERTLGIGPGTGENGMTAYGDSLPVGMSDELGPIAYAENQEEVFLGHSISRQQNISEATAQKIDSEVRRIIDESYTRAQKILTERINELHILAKGLLEYETPTGEEIKALLRGERPVRTPYEEPEPSQQTRPPATVPSSGRGREPGGGFISPEPQPGT